MSALKKRDIKSFSVKSDQSFIFAQISIQLFQQILFLVVIPHPKLMRFKSAFCKPSYTYKERNGSRAAAKTGGFGIQKHDVFDLGDIYPFNGAKLGQLRLYRKKMRLDIKIFDYLCTFFDLLFLKVLSVLYLVAL